jgi:alkylated DNA repair dioxygenase AlkB
MSLFTAENTWEILPMVDADVRLCAAFDLGQTPRALMDELVAQTTWRQDSIRIHGQTHVQPRLHAWVGDADAVYTYSGLRMQPEPWTPTLQAVRQRVEAACQSRFNSVLLNLYRHERDSMGMHADDEPELGPRPIIASLSLGEVRTLVFKHRQHADLKPVRIALPSGSLLCMAGGTQAHWKHGIAKQSRALAARLNLTFRWVTPQAPQSRA